MLVNVERLFKNVCVGLARANRRTSSSLPTAFLWIAVVLQEQFGLGRPLEMLTNRAPAIMFVGLALLLPFATISFGLGEWKSGSETGGLMAALIATLFLSFALIATIWPEAVQGAEWSSVT